MIATNVALSPIPDAARTTASIPRRNSPAVRREKNPLLLIMGPHFCSMQITDNVRKYPAEQGIAEEEALKEEMEEKSCEFMKKGAEVYAKA
jgi:hypothetical protein